MNYTIVHIARPDIWNEKKRRKKNRRSVKNMSFEHGRRKCIKAKVKSSSSFYGLMIQAEKMLRLNKHAMRFSSKRRQREKEKEKKCEQFSVLHFVDIFNGVTVQAECAKMEMCHMKWYWCDKWFISILNYRFYGTIHLDPFRL